MRSRVPEGTSVMRAAALAGVQVPKLCATDTLKAFGSCRLCLVEVEGRKGYPASCTTTVATGMKIRTQSQKLQQLRRSVMELYLSDSSARAPAERGRGADANCAPWRAARSDVDSVRQRQAPSRRQPKDESNPYFTFDPDSCIVCSRCVRACDEVQGTFALTIQGRGFSSKVRRARTSRSSNPSASPAARASRPARPRRSPRNRSSAWVPPSARSTTTCAYCGVGCGFKAELRGAGEDVEVVRMAPDRAGHANHGHACVKGRFAYGYATHPDRVLKPMIRKSIRDNWREVSWEEAIGYAASEIRRIQAKYGRDSVGGITSSRCTNEETFLVQKLVRAAFGNNNVDTCARVCHSPTGYGLKNTLGESAGTQAFDSVMKADTVLIIGANPTDGHPVFASQMKRRLRQGAKLIIADPREIALVRTPHIQADEHLQLKPGTNVALLNALAHVVVTEGLVKEDYVAERCEPDSFAKWRAFVAEERNSPEASESVTGVPAERVRHAARLYAQAGNAAIYYGLGVTEHSQGTTTVMAIANLAMATGNLGREGVRRQPAARPEQRAGLVRHGLVPARVQRLPPRVGSGHAGAVRGRLGSDAAVRAGAAHSQHVRGGPRRHLQGHVRAGRGLRAVRSQHAPRERRDGLDGVRDRAGPVPQRDRQVRARVPARLLVPREGRHLHQRRAAHGACAQDHAAARRLRGLADHHACCPMRSATRCTTTTRRRSWRRSRASPRPSAG